MIIDIRSMTHIYFYQHKIRCEMCSLLESALVATSLNLEKVDTCYQLVSESDIRCRDIVCLQEKG